VRGKCIYDWVKSREGCRKNYGSQWFAKGLNKDLGGCCFWHTLCRNKKMERCPGG
jgi:hypothetical protein